MTGVLSPAVILATILLVTILTFAVAIRTLLSSRRSEVLGEDRYKLLRDQHERLEFLREERQMLIDQLERQSREREQLTKFLGKTPPQLVEDLEKGRAQLLEANERIEDLNQQRLRLEQELRQLEEQLERERQGRFESQRRAERLERQQKEQSSDKQELERLGQERQRLAEDLKREREEHLGAKQRAEERERERARLEKESRRLRAELDSHKRARARDRGKKSEPSRPWWRRPVVVASVLLGALLMWLTSLLTALYLVSP